MMEAKTTERDEALLKEHLPEPQGLAVRMMAPPPVMSEEEVKRTWRVSELLAKSNFFKDSRQATQAFAKVMFGRDLGLSPTEAMTAIHVIEGRPEMSADLHASRVKASERYDYRVRELTNEKCVIEFRECSDKTGGEWTTIGVSEYTTEDADLANLRKETSGGHPSNHVKFPRNMLFARAMTNGVAWYCPDVMGGLRIYGPGEIQAGAVDAEPGGAGSGDVLSMDDVPWGEDPLIAARLKAAVTEANEHEPNRWSAATLQMQLGGRSHETLVKIVEEMETENERRAAEQPVDAEVVEDEAEATQEQPQEAETVEPGPEAAGQDPAEEEPEEGSETEIIRDTIANLREQIAAETDPEKQTELEILLQQHEEHLRDLAGKAEGQDALPGSDDE